MEAEIIDVRDLRLGPIARGYRYIGWDYETAIELERLDLEWQENFRRVAIALAEQTDRMIMGENDDNPTQSLS